MKKLQLDTGVEEFQIVGGGVLRFNPTDPNLYARFLEAEEKLKELEKAFAHQDCQTPEAVLAGLTRADREIKNLLGWVFGEGNDFHAALGGVNLLSKTKKGACLLENLLAALETVLVKGAEAFADARVSELKNGGA